MKYLRAVDLIKAEYGQESRNFMTPDVIEYGWIRRGEIAYELSEGTGIPDKNWSSGPPIFGVSVARGKEDGTTERMFDESKMFYSEKEAREHIKDLRESYKR